MRTNIKLEVTPEQSKAIQIICFANNIKWGGGPECEVKHTYAPFLYIGNRRITFSNDVECFKNNTFEEVSADFFIKTNALLDNGKFISNGFEVPDFPCTITHVSKDKISAIVGTKKHTHHCCMYNKKGHCYSIDLVEQKLTRWPSKDLKPLAPWYDKCSYPAIVYTSEKLVVVVQDRDFFGEEFLKKCVLLSDEEIDNIKQQ